MHYGALQRFLDERMATKDSRGLYGDGYVEFN